MTSLTLFTSGSTKEPKQVTHSWSAIDAYAQQSMREIGLTKDDVVLDVFPGNTIAHFTVTAYPAQLAGSRLVSASFEPYSYIKLFNEFRPTYISLIPRHWQILSKTKGWADFDMSCVRYMVVGSGICTQEMIDDFRARGVKLVANWYGMTEMPPPVLIGYNSESFNFNPTPGYTVEFSDAGECIINGQKTGDLFDLNSNKFVRRISVEQGRTWKTS